jgi:hypothetical protein
MQKSSSKSRRYIFGRATIILIKLNAAGNI